MAKKKGAFPQFKSPDGEIFTCIFFATKTPPGIEWFGFRIESKDKKDIIYYGIVDARRWELAYFSLNDVKRLKADYTTDPDIINRINLPAGWERYTPMMITY